MDDLWRTISAGIFGAVGVPLILYLWGLFLSRERVRRLGVNLGRMAAKFLNQRLGVDGGERLQERITSTLDDFTAGLRTGMSDDN